MNRLFILVICSIIDTNYSEFQQFNLCSENSFFNVNFSGQANATSTAVYAASALQCCRKCSTETYCIGANIKLDLTSPYQFRSCELIVGSVDDADLLNPCLLTEEVMDSRFYKKDILESTKIQSSTKVFEIDTTGSIVYGSASEIDNKLKQGERMQILLKNFNNSADDLRVRADMVHMSSIEICAQSVFNFELDVSLVKVYRTIIHICISGRVEIQVWRLWEEMTFQHTFMNAASVWFSDGSPKTEVISTNGSGDLAFLRNSVYSGQDIITYRSNLATSHHNVWINISDIAIQYSWEISLTREGANIQLYTRPYWFATEHFNIADLSIMRFDMETGRLISGDLITNYYKSYLLDTSWKQIHFSEIQTYLDQGKQLRLVFSDRADTVDRISQHIPSGSFTFLIDGIIESNESDMKQIFYILTSTTSQKFTVDNDTFAYEYEVTSPVTIKWFAEDNSCTLIHSTSKNGATNITGIDFEAAFYSGKQVRIKFTFYSYNYYLTVDNVRRTDNIYLATYYGFSFRAIGGFSEQVHFLFWSNGAVRIVIRSNTRSTNLIMTGYFDTWWFIC